VGQAFGRGGGQFALQYHAQVEKFVDLFYLEGRDHGASMG
jgi:hypothetical protein